MSSKPTQEEMVLDYLQRGNTLTSFEAIEKWGATRLSAIIYNLRQQGYQIVSENQRGINRFGNPSHWVAYYLPSKRVK